MGLLYKIYMVIVKQYFTVMLKSTGTIPSKQLAFDAFMGRRLNNDQPTDNLPEAVDDLYKSSTGFKSCPFVLPQCVGPFWDPPPPSLSRDKQKKRVESRTPTECMKDVVRGLTKTQVSTKKFSSVLLERFGLPILSTDALLTDMGIVCEKNRKKMVDLQEMHSKMNDFVKALSCPHKPVKRGREDVPSRHIQPLSDRELLNTLLTRFMSALLSTHGVGCVALNEIFQIGFVHLNSIHMRQVLTFLSNTDNIWILLRILMEIRHLNVEVIGQHVFLSIETDFTFRAFNLDANLALFQQFKAELPIMHDIAEKARREEEVQLAKEKQRIDSFISALWMLWNKKNIEAFFRELLEVSPEFNSCRTNWRFLPHIVYDFMRVYNATTRTYCNGQPCLNPLQDFLEFATKRGVFLEPPEEGAFVRVCDCSSKQCIFGDKCSGVHPDFVNKHWRPRGEYFGQCCSDYMNSGTCRNSYCRYAHANIWEYWRAYRHGSNDSKKKREIEVQARLKE